MAASARTCSINTKVSESELARVRELADARGLDVSGFTRQLLLREMSGDGRAGLTVETSEKLEKIAARLEGFIRVMVLTKEEELEMAAEGKRMTPEAFHVICEEAKKRHA